ADRQWHDHVSDSRVLDLRTFPLVYLRVAFRKCEPASAIVKAGGHVNDLGRAWFIGAVTFIGKGGVVYTVGMFIYEDPGLGRIHDHGLFIVCAPRATGKPTATAEHLAHGDAPHPGHALTLIVFHRGVIGRAFVNLAAVTGVRPNGTLDKIVGNVPVHTPGSEVK